ncbi:hypothetical protein CBS101457_005536 [Exobasidium rhododendri]|nr:hypothetical protein CBS101457_005536 [Exobasidium rhododendri]
MASKIPNALASTFVYIYNAFRSLFSTTHLTTGKYTVLLHTSPLVRYQSPLYVVISLVTHDVDATTTIDPSSLKITLVRRGWRAGLLGWSAARYLGVSLKNGIDISPEHQEKWGAESGGDDDMEMEHKGQEGKDEDQVALLPKPALSTKRQESIEKQLKSTTIRHGLPPHKVLATCLVRIPAQSGDGYFRLAIDAARQPTAFSPSFRIFSLSLSSACPRGSSLLPPTVVPELLLRTLSTILYSALLALFPVAAILEKVLPRSWARWMMLKLYRSLGMEQKTQKLMKNYNVQERLDVAKTQVDQKIPWASAGIRTQFEIRRDEQRGVGGVTYVWN